MQLNVMTPRLEMLVSVVRASSRREAEKADLVCEGCFDLGLVWLWCLHLAQSAEHVDVQARTRAVRLTATQALRELAPLVVAAARLGDPLLRVWEKSAGKYLGANPRIPELHIAPTPPLRNLDGTTL